MIKHEYKDYDEYRTCQILGNVSKIDLVFTKKQTVSIICKFLNGHRYIRKGLCHGARNGKEVSWFNKYLARGKAAGTDISNTAKLFSNMIVHDFNKERKNWIDKFDFVYSNSWDHAFEIEKTFAIWEKQLKKKGFLILETSHKHASDNRDEEMDPYRMDKEELIGVVSKSTNLLMVKEIKIEKGHILIWKKSSRK